MGLWRNTRAATSMTFFDLQDLFHSRMKALPAEDLNMSTRTLMFRVLSRSASCGHCLLSASQRSYPFKMIAEVLSGNPSAVLADDQKCLHDPLTSRFLSRYGSVDALMSLDAQHELQAIAQALEFDISGIEARRAGIRRVVHARSIQAQALTLGAASAEFVCRSFSQRVSPQRFGPCFP